jgi:hypothetical protein
VKIVTDKSGDDPIVWLFLKDKCNLPWSTDLRTLGQQRSDFTLNAAIGYNNWINGSCFMHVAFDSAKSLTRELLREAFKYPFETCTVIFGLTPITNKPALQFNKKLGFVEVYRSEFFVLQEMRRENCKWIKENTYGRNDSTSKRAISRSELLRSATARQPTESEVVTA